MTVAPVVSFGWAEKLIEFSEVTANSKLCSSGYLTLQSIIKAKNGEALLDKFLTSDCDSPLLEQDVKDLGMKATPNTGRPAVSGVVSGQGQSGASPSSPGLTQKDSMNSRLNGQNSGFPGQETSGSGDEAIRVERQYGDVPSSRFGHTTTNVGNNKIVLFGGAIGDAGKYNTTADTYLFDCSCYRWSKLTAENTPPARAAHASACVDSMQLVIYGGATGGGTLSSDELYLLDIRKTTLCWMIVPVGGVTPGRRYGHVLTYQKPNLLVFGGNDGTQTVNDIWHMDVEKSPFVWQALEITSVGRSPPSRVYHSAEICREGPAAGMMVIFGGRSQENKSLRDAWGLRQHRDGRWDWVEAPVKKGNLPDARYQHTSAFLGTKLLIIGGRADTDSTRPLPTALYDTETVEWRYLPSISRFRHSSWCIENQIYTFGGFGHTTQHNPTEDLQCLNCPAIPSFFNEREIQEVRRKQIQSSALRQPVGSSHASLPFSTSNEKRDPGLTAAVSPGISPASSSKTTIPTGRPPVSGRDSFTAKKSEDAVLSQQTSAPIENKLCIRPQSSNRSADVKLSTHAHAVHDTHKDFSSLVRRISIERLGDEGRKLCRPTTATDPQDPLGSSCLKDRIEDQIIKNLLLPSLTMTEFQRFFKTNALFPLSRPDIISLCDQVLEIVKNDEMVLKLRAPIKVYGDIHGQFYDLMRLFRLYKAPVGEDVGDHLGIEGDIDSIDYLFLGDYVDRGANSLETICLLFALKCKYPRQIHLIRGNHEDPGINSIYGFSDECARRLKEDPENENSCWSKFNDVFEYLPVGATIEDKVLCIHGGIGGSITKISQIAQMERPLKVAAVPTTLYEQRVTDLLWSDPTDNDTMLGVVPNDVRDPDGSGHIVKFGPDRVQQFQADNRISLIIRAHECVMDGFERFADGKLITLFSATNYCNHHHNAGALLFIKRDLTVVPKLIYPAEAQYRVNTWDQKMTELRPPTPPRTLPRMRERELF